MKDALRRVLIFFIMVSTGTALILLDQPLLFIIALVTVFGFLLYVLLTPDPAAGLNPSIKNITKISFIRRDTGGKPYIKRAEPKAAEPEKTIEMRVEPAPVTESDRTEEKKDFSLYSGSLASSFRSLATFLRTGKRPDRVEEPDKIPGTTAREKGNISALALAGELSQEGKKQQDRGSATPGSSGAGTVPSSPHANDPFLSLSSDELESGLYDTVDEEEEKKGPATRPDTPLSDPAQNHVQGSSGVTIGESDIPIPPQEIQSGTDEQPEPAEPDLEEFDSLEGSDTIDENLEDLDTIDLDSVELDEDGWEEGTDTTPPAPPSPPEAMAPAPDEQGAQGPAAPGSPLSEIPGLNPRAMEQSDMAVFTAPPSADDEMVSSLATDMKVAKKTKDTSLLRELKEIKAPGAKEIEEELSDLYSGLNAFSDKKNKTKLS